ncbi:MAG: Gfo/Idh/MocA family oxidoreductase [Gammaproteobacteria bacterium]|nr:Gfo/Idh/MocA family oxidoreductase [Gammaproteobacteria bacterium]
MENLRVGVVGVGYLGRFHARIFAEMPGVELVGVADIDPGAAEVIGTLHGCSWFTDPGALIGKVEAVSIVVPTSAHREVALPYLEAGIHMMLEKPVAGSLADARAIVEAAERCGVTLQVGHVERYNAGIMALADRVQSPRFIEAHRLGTFVERATDVDVVTDLMIHDIDIVLSLVDSKIRRVAAMGLPVLTDHVDIANARIEFENGAVANVTASRVSNKKFRRIRVFGPDCYQALNFIDQRIDVVSTGKIPEGQRFPEIVTEQIQIESRQPLDAELADFIGVVRDGRAPLVSGQDGLAALEVAFQVQQAIQASLG